MRLTPSTFTKNLHYLLLGLLFAGCSTEKESGFNRAMQNMTAHYNIIFNANELLRQKQETVAAGYIDNYGQILSVYQDTAPRTRTVDKQLDAVVTKANTVISDKTQSHYIGDAYMLLGKANFMEDNYFNAIEFFSYVTRTFPKNKDMVQEARTWKARSLMHIDQIDVADTLLDTVIRNVFPKEKNIADVYASRLQYDIYTEKYADGEAMAVQAIHFSHDIRHRLRWIYILAQLQEINHKPAEAAKNYGRVVNSNSSFEMGFNASLNRIRIEDAQNGNVSTRANRLRRLLKDDKNKDFIDQIYFQIGEIYLAQNNYDEAIKNYKLSIRSSTTNLNQRGLSYLRIADINFKYKADYTNAKKYYDSTLVNLSPNYPGYKIIQRKSNNLQLLVDRLQIIAREDTLQMLATLNDKDRATKITDIVTRDLQQQQAAAAASKTGPFTVPQTTLQSSSINSTSSFYFYNTNAIAQGNNDFKRVWGNRPLADNWRLSQRAGADNSNPQLTSTIQQLNSTNSPNQVAKPVANPALAKMQQDLAQNVPNTPAKLIQSNTRIFNAYMDIANFYRDILEDKKEAIAIFELLLKRFPNNINKPSIYYNLYRLYSDIDPVKSDYYKNLILKNYPESDFAKVILDPAFNQKLDDKNAAFTTAYTQLFDMIAHRKYGEASVRASDLITQYPGNPFLAQVYYLRAIAMGHQQKLEPFRAELLEIQDKYPQDRLITPLVKQHLDFIAANETAIAARDTVLIDADPTAIPFMEQQRTSSNPYMPDVAYVRPKPQPKPNKPAAPKPVVNTPKPAKIDSAKFAKTIVIPEEHQNIDSLGNFKEKPVEAPSIFSLRDSTNYYFVVDVSTNKVNLSPSRFGIGQFNRTNIKDNSIKHQLKGVADNQLIYVGRFKTLADVKAYARAIVPLLPEIMNVPKDKYNFFIITQENLDKLADKKTLDSYFDFYQKKY